MMTIAKLSTSCALLLTMAACGGGTGGGQLPNNPLPPAVGLGEPASTSQDDLNAWVRDTRLVNLTMTPSSNISSDIHRRQRTIMIDGEQVVVSVYQDLEGSVQMIRHSDGDIHNYQVFANPDSIVESPSDALYVGRSDAMYRLSSNDAVQHGHGDVSVALDTRDGSMGYGVGIFSQAGDRTSVEIFGNAIIQPDGSWIDVDNEVILRRDGVLWVPATGHEQATVAGAHYAVDGVEAIVAGTITGSNESTGFEINGGFISGQSRPQ